MSYDLVVVGSGMASSMFLKRYLEKTKNTKVLVLERGNKQNNHEWQIKHKAFSPINYQETFVNETPKKRWLGTIGFGGTTSNWIGNTPRMMPNDFQLKTKYGVGYDWPISYDQLELNYCQVEDILRISGPEKTPYFMSQKYPLPPHNLNNIDLMMKKHYPSTFFSCPTARPSINTRFRPQCCASSVCKICPINSKATVLNTIADIYDNPRVTLQMNSHVYALGLHNNYVSEVYYMQDNKEAVVKGDLVVLGAHAIHNPNILLNSGDSHPWLGKGLGEQVSINARVLLENLSNTLNGSTRITGFDYTNYDGEHRRERAASLIEFDNVPRMRLKKNKLTNFLDLRVVVEDIPSQKNYVKMTDNRFIPSVSHNSFSNYAARSIKHFKDSLASRLHFLPIEDIVYSNISATEGHTQGTVRMSKNVENGVIDDKLMHHKYRNLVVLGSSAFPTFSPANPTLTLSALSLYSADNIL